MLCRGVQFIHRMLQGQYFGRPHGLADMRWHVNMPYGFHLSDVRQLGRRNHRHLLRRIWCPTILLLQSAANRRHPLNQLIRHRKRRTGAQSTELRAWRRNRRLCRPRHYLRLLLLLSAPMSRWWTTRWDFVSIAAAVADVVCEHPSRKW